MLLLVVKGLAQPKKHSERASQGLSLKERLVKSLWFPVTEPEETSPQWSIGTLRLADLIDSCVEKTFPVSQILRETLGTIRPKTCEIANPAVGGGRSQD
jgi:hypothetical protein